MTDIKRFPGTATGRSRAVSFDKLVWVVSNATSPGGTFASQCREMFALADETLSKAGSGKDKLISVQVYLADITSKPEFDSYWNEWIGPDEQHWPQRVCVEAKLSGDLLVEMQIVAVLK
jgi:enamine deaminase RidA (YjgF/YER057c/UK114 family)